MNKYTEEFNNWWKEYDGYGAASSMAKEMCYIAWNARVPEGCVVVPIEPTEKIVKASCPWPYDNNSCINMIRSEYKTAYKVMIAAAEEE